MRPFLTSFGAIYLRAKASLKSAMMFVYRHKYLLNWYQQFDKICLSTWKWWKMLKWSADFDTIKASPCDLGQNKLPCGYFKYFHFLLEGGQRLLSGAPLTQRTSFFVYKHSFVSSTLYTALYIYEDNKCRASEVILN